jgi:hypothetical protein
LEVNVANPNFTKSLVNENFGSNYLSLLKIEIGGFTTEVGYLSDHVISLIATPLVRRTDPPYCQLDVSGGQSVGVSGVRSGGKRTDSLTDTTIDSGHMGGQSPSKGHIKVFLGSLL